MNHEQSDKNKPKKKPQKKRLPHIYEMYLILKINPEINPKNFCRIHLAKTQSSGK
jgi:hypothetical protein